MALRLVLGARLCFLFFIYMQYEVTLGAKDMNLYCGACKAIVDEVEYEISKVDPKKMIDVGSFRVDPKGKTKTVKVPYARSEALLTELLEEVCTKMNTYAESKSDNGKRKYVRTSSRDGEAIELNNISMSSDTAKKLKFACESVIEEHEEDFIKLFAASDPDIVNKVCADMGEYCDEEDNEADSTNKEEL